MVEFLIPLFVICFVPWLVAGWFRIPRYVGYFQYEDYDFNRSFRMIRNKAETRYLRTLVISITILFFVEMCSLVNLGTLMFSHPVAMVAVNLGLVIFTISFVPRKLPVEQDYRREPRGIRLLVIAFWAEFVPILIGLGLIGNIFSVILDPKNSPESMILVFGFVDLVVAIGICIGPVTFLLTPYIVVVAHFINRFIETVYGFRLH